MNKKWYLKTWMICLFFVPTITPLGVITLPIGLILLSMKIKNEKKLYEKYGSIEELDNKINSLSSIYEAKNKDLESDYKLKESNLEKTFFNKKQDLESYYSECERDLKAKYNSLKSDYNKLNTEYKELDKNVILAHYDFSSYDGITSEECKNKITLLKTKEKELIKSNEAVNVYSEESKTVINNNVKQLLRCFNSECDNILMKVSTKNIDSMRSKISKSFETLNRIFSVDNMELTQEILEIKLEELNLAYTYELKHQQEIELQKEIKAQMVEEEKVRRELEQEKKKIEKDQAQFNKEVTKLMSYLQKTDNDVEKQLYADKIKELEDKLKELEENKKSVNERATNAKAGFVYVISNIGSFGEDIYKIGMTRRLEPMDRIKELSNASVPFEFDVYAMIFSEDAPDLENKLHQHFRNNSVNKINPRKEFFHTSIDEIEKVVKENFNNTVEFTKIPIATEYRQTLALSEQTE